jgi:hypothetical protein
LFLPVLKKSLTFILVADMIFFVDSIMNFHLKPKWRNWQTRTTQNRVPLWSVGSTPTFGTKAKRFPDEGNRFFIV